MMDKAEGPLSTKTEALELFGNDFLVMGEWLCCTRQAIYQWDEELTQRRRLQVIGAALDEALTQDSYEDINYRLSKLLSVILKSKHSCEINKLTEVMGGW